MNQIKLIACDLDGTLLLDGATSCSQELFPIVDELTRRGVYFMPASGRQYNNLRNLFAPVKDQMMYICENGALVIYQDRVILKREFQDGLALELCHAVLAHPECEVLISGERVSYLIPKETSYVTLIRDVVKNTIQMIQRPEEIQEPIIKVSYFTRPEVQKEVTGDFAKQFQTQCQIVTSGNQWVDFAPFHTSKGDALNEISKKFDIPPEQMAAFGDNENDRTMLEYVGNPFIMENSNPTIFDIPGEGCKKVEETLQMLLKNNRII